MLWEVEIRPKQHDSERARVCDEFKLLTHGSDAGRFVTAASRGFLLEGELNRTHIDNLAAELLVDPLVEVAEIHAPKQGAIEHQGFATVLLKPGVMDPVALSVVNAAHDLGIPVDSVRTFRRYFGTRPDHAERDLLYGRVFANDAIEQVVEGALHLDHLALGTAYSFRLVRVPVRELDERGLQQLSREGQLSLSLAEMKTIQAHLRELGREPSDVELETIAQTWSEHCSHKTLKGTIDFETVDAQGRPSKRRYHNLLKETIFGSTQEIRRRLGTNDWCVSVFEDNAGVVRFDDRFNVCFKVETHNHPSAIEPYGGANTGLGGVIRDPLGTGLGARPVCNTDVFCFAPPDTPPESLSAGVLHPRKIMKGVVSGVRDYGNRIGIPTVNGAVCFDDRYLANPLVFCGTVGLIPVDRCRKEPKPGDLIVAAGGRTGRDGIHGATFSSIELTSESEKTSGGAVQIGNAIVEKKLLDVLLQARDAGLYHAVTDCGAGGFSSAVGEMGEKIGAAVHLDKAPLKYAGLTYTEIWISESQERMVLAVPPENWERLRKLFADEDVEAAVIGTFEATGRLKLFYGGEQVGDLSMKFLHDGRPEVVRTAKAPERAGAGVKTASRETMNPNDILLKILSSYNVCSKEWIIRQYDHEVQGGSVLKPLVGVRDDGPGDAAVVAPVLGSRVGIAVGCGLNPRYGDLDPYRMAACAVDEAVRNVVAVGADPARIALLDNFCWGNTDRPELLGSLVLAAEACRDAALALNMPFISGKDSLNNEFHAGSRNIVIPPTLLISALGRVPDVRRCVSMDFKEVGNLVFLLGTTRDEMGGSHHHLVTGQDGGTVPGVDFELALRIFKALHSAIERGLVRACHDLSEGGLATAVAEMAFAGGLGADITGLRGEALPDAALLFSESATRFVLTAAPARAAELQECFKDLPLKQIGEVVKEPRLRIAGSNGEWAIWANLADLKEAWQKPLRW
jgi:phosphoribosylformylglycinamidine synthase